MYLSVHRLGWIKSPGQCKVNVTLPENWDKVNDTSLHVTSGSGIPMAYHVSYMLAVRFVPAIPSRSCNSHF